MTKLMNISGKKPPLLKVRPTTFKDGRLRQNIYLYEPQFNYLREYAHANYVSMSEVIRALIDKLASERMSLTLHRTPGPTSHPLDYQKEPSPFSSNSVLG